MKMYQKKEKGYCSWHKQKFKYVNKLYQVFSECEVQMQCLRIYILFAFALLL